MRSIYQHISRKDLWDIALVVLAVALVGASFGAISVGGGLPVWLPCVLSVFVFAGASQFAAVGIILAGGSPVSAVIAGLILNARLLPFSFAVADRLGHTWWQKLIGAHLTTDEATAFALKHKDFNRSKTAFWVCAVPLFVCWNLAVLAGALAGSEFGNAEDLGLDAAFPVVLLALILPALRQPGLRNAALVGGAIAILLTPCLPAGLPVLAALMALLPSLRRYKAHSVAAPDQEPSSCR